MTKMQTLSTEQEAAGQDRENLPPSFHTAPKTFRRLGGPVPQSFERFYRAHLRFVSGARLKSMDVGRFYSAWAKLNEAASLTANDVKRAMANIGHRALRSNGIQYCDVALAAEHVDTPDNFPTLPAPSEAAADALANRLDAMITELSSIRAQVLHNVH